MAGYVTPGGGSSGSVPTSTSSTSGSTIGGSLTFGGGGGGMFYGGEAGLAASYNSAYNSALATNQQNYDNILAGYQQLMGNQQAAQQNITTGYNNLTTQVLGDIQGSNTAQVQMTDKSYAQQAAQASQQLTNSGLNNSTVVSSVQRGITFDQQLAQTNIANQFAQLTAQYQSSLGLAGLQYQDSANQQNTQLGVQQLNWMNSVQAPYPDAGAYSSLMSYYGQQDQANQDRQAMTDLYGQMLGASGGTTGGGLSGVYGTQPVPYYGTSTTGSYSIPGTSPGGTTNAYSSSYGTPSFSSYDYNSGMGALGGGYAGYDTGYYSSGGYDSYGYGGGGNF